MTSFFLEKYFLKIKDHANKTCSFEIFPESVKDFLSTKKIRRKLYIVSHESDCFYVGETNTSIKERMNRGFRSYNTYAKTGIKKAGYGGYKWISPQNNLQREMVLHVYTFDDKYDNDREYVEVVEAEFCFLVRQHKKQWPTFQNEIHFNNHKDSQSAERLAREIFNQIWKNLL